jgi:cell wall-associated NlpC family hydrolase
VLIQLLLRLLAGLGVIATTAATPALLGPAPAPAASDRTARVVASAPAPTPAWVRVSVATVWNRPSFARPVDRPALGDPAQVATWLDRLTLAQRLDLDSRLATQLLLGQPVFVLRHVGRWAQVQIPAQRGSRFPRGIVGWVPAVQLAKVPPPAGRREVIVAARVAQLHWLSAAGAVGAVRYQVSYDTELPALGARPGYVVVGLPDARRGALPAAAVRTVQAGAVSGAAVVRQALGFVGLPYLWAGTSGFGYDCSGLVYSVYGQYGRLLPRDAADQQHAGPAVSLANLRPGDLLFFGAPAHHVAIYAGGGLMIDAPHTGASVEVVPMRTAPIWAEFAGATRIATAA